MRRFLFALGTIVAVAGAAAPAQAQNYPWCAYYGQGMGGSSNCGFTTYEQCMAALSGNGGFCEPNNQYIPVHAPEHKIAPRPKRRRHS